MKKHRIVIVASCVVLAGLGLGAALAAAQSSDPPPQSGTTVDEKGVRDFIDALPERQRVPLPDGNIGYADSRKLHEHSPLVGPGSDETSQWLHELIPVTAEANPASDLLGYYARGGVGFIDKITVDSPSFNLDSLLAEARARNQRDVDAIANQLGRE
jgi:hypothetical protein